MPFEAKSFGIAGDLQSPSTWIALRSKTLRGPLKEEKAVGGSKDMEGFAVLRSAPPAVLRAAPSPATARSVRRAPEVKALAGLAPRSLS